MLLAETVKIYQEFDWVTQVVVPFVAAIVGGVAVLFAAILTVRGQAQASLETLQTQLSEERNDARQQREADRDAEVNGMLRAAYEELRVNSELAGNPKGAYGWAPMSTEFTLRLLAGHANMADETRRLLTDAFLKGNRYNAAILADIHRRESDMQSDLTELAGSASASMKSAYDTRTQELRPFAA